jgi:hypothetical protein
MLAVDQSCLSAIDYSMSGIYLSKHNFSYILLAAKYVTMQRSTIIASSPELRPAKKWLSWNLRSSEADKKKALNHFLVI